MTPPPPATLAAQPFNVLKTWPPTPQSVGRARQFLAQHLDAWGLPQLKGTAELVLSELVTNAVRHAFPPYGRLIGTRFERLESGGVRIEVHDPSENKPEPRDAPTYAESGRGLALVDALTDGQWGVSDRDEGPGKLVWACIAAHDANDAKPKRCDASPEAGERLVTLLIDVFTGGRLITAHRKPDVNVEPKPRIASAEEQSELILSLVDKLEAAQRDAIDGGGLVEVVLAEYRADGTVVVLP